MMLVYRFEKEKYKHDILSGNGAKEFPGRWNASGMRIIYTSGSTSLALIESLVHINSYQVFNSLNYLLAVLSVPESIIDLQEKISLKLGWEKNTFTPPVSEFIREWVQKKKSLVLKVPSVICPADSNYLLNPMHPSIHEVKIVSMSPFKLDSRLIKT